MRYIETRDVPIDEAEDFPGNARLHDEEYLDESAETNGQYRAVVMRHIPGKGKQKDRLVILCGHGTRAAFRRKGAPTVRAEIIECDDAEALRINIVDNPRQGVGGFDEELLAKQLEAAKALAGGLTGTGWNAEAYADLMARLDAPPSLDDLEEEHGGLGEGDLWPVLKIKVPPETRSEFLALMEHPAFEAWVEEHERFGVLLQKARQALGE